MLNHLLPLFLFPFSLIWWLITYCRRQLYKANIFKSYQPEVATICIGNLIVGGVGKTPHTLYYARKLSQTKIVAILSRGYGRKTKGLLKVDEVNAQLFGDEPAMIRSKLPNSVPIYVSENREKGLKYIMEQHPEVELVLLDDAYQHLKVRCHKYILLTEHERPYFKDFVLPMGRLREPRQFARQADEIIVTKSPVNLSQDQRRQYCKQLPDKPIHFSSIIYNDYVAKGTVAIPLYRLKEHHHILVTGIDNPKPLVQFLTMQGIKFEHKQYPDHHVFSDKEIAEICVAKPKYGIIITTEKDMVRLAQRRTIRPFLFALGIDVRFI